MSRRKRPTAKMPSEILAAQLPEWRRVRGLSSQQLADRVGSLGLRLGRVAITKIENGQRGISLDEALVLAAALNVPPSLLFFPMRSGEPVRITSKSEIHPDLAAQWLGGEGPLALSDRTAMNAPEWGQALWSDAARPLRAYRAHREAQGRVHDADLRMRRAHLARDADGERAARYHFVDRLQRLADVREAMREDGITPPKLDPRLASEIEALTKEQR